MAENGKRVPAFVCIYGASGRGKTTDAGYSFPKGLFIASPGALKPLHGLCGYRPAEMDANTIDDVTALIKKASGNKAYDAIIVDDFSFLAEQTMVRLERRYKGFKLFGALREAVVNFRNAARYAKCHVVLTCWEKGPKTRDDGTTIRGGPKLTGDLPEAVPAMCDLVLRAAVDPLRKPWPGIYRVDSGTNWVGKDRDHVTPNPAPMNLGEILRLGGYEVARHPSLPWQEEMVEGLAAQLGAGTPGDDPKQVTEVYRHLLQNGISPQHARWTVRDGWDRAVLRRAHEARWATFF